MRLKDLIDDYPWDAIRPVLLRLYPNQADQLSAYKQVYRELQDLQPQEMAMRIVIDEVVVEIDQKSHAVHGKDGLRWIDDDPTISPEDPQAFQEVEYALEFTGWSEWLGMGLDAETLRRYPAEEIIAHCLWEMTYFGFSQETIRTVMEQIQSGKGEVKGKSQGD